MDRLDPEAIQGARNLQGLGGKVVVFESTASTNDVAAEYARNPDNHGLVVFAEHQTAGRGRGANRWWAGQGDSLLCSIVLTRCDLPCELLSLTAAVAVAEAVGHGARIKWPNDVLLLGRKVAGVLVESKACPGHRAWVIGIGINCHQKTADFPASVQAEATSLDSVTGARADRVSLARRLLSCLGQWLDHAGTDPGQVIARWRAMSCQIGQRVSVLYRGRRYSGTCVGVDPEQGLIVQLDLGGVRMFDAAHSRIAKSGDEPH